MRQISDENSPPLAVSDQKKKQKRRTIKATPSRSASSRDTPRAPRAGADTTGDGGGDDPYDPVETLMAEYAFDEDLYEQDQDQFDAMQASQSGVDSLSAPPRSRGHTSMRAPLAPLHASVHAPVHASPDASPASRTLAPRSHSRSLPSQPSSRGVPRSVSQSGARGGSEEARRGSFSPTDAEGPAMTSSATVLKLKNYYDYSALNALAHVSRDYNELKSMCVLEGNSYTREEEYAHSRLLPRHGRIYSHPFPCYDMKSTTRCHLMCDTQMDLDIVNCGATLMPQALFKVNYQGRMDAVEQYRTERELWLEGVCEAIGCERDKAKDLFTALLGGQGLNGWLTNEGAQWQGQERLKQSVRELSNQVRRAAEWTECDPAIDKMFRSVDLSEKRNDGLHRLAILVQMAEFRCVLSAIHAAQQAGYLVTAYMFDGFHIKCTTAPAGLLEGLGDVVWRQTGYHVEFKIKSLAPATTLQETLVYENNRCLVPVPVFDGKGRRDGAICDYVASNHYENLLVTGRKLWYCVNGIWSVEDRQIPACFFKDCPSPYNGDDSAAIIRVVDMLRVHPALQRKVKWGDVPAHMLVLENCMLNVYTLETLQLKPSHYIQEGNKLDIVWQGSGACRGDPLFEEEWRQLDMDNGRLYAGDPELENGVETIFAEFALISGNPRPKAFFMLGDGANGKTAAVGRLKSVFGKKWVYSGNRSLFAGQRSSASPELVAMLESHVTIIDESKSTDKKPMDADVFKELVNDKADYMARRLYSNELCDTNRMAPIFISNHPVVFSDMGFAVTRRMIQVDLPSLFHPDQASLNAALAEHPMPILEDGIDPQEYDRLMACHLRAVSRNHLQDSKLVDRYGTPKMRLVYFRSLLDRLEHMAPAEGKPTDLPAIPEYALKTDIAAKEATSKKTLKQIYHELFKETGDGADAMLQNSIATSIRQIDQDLTETAVHKFLLDRAENGKIKKHPPPAVKAKITKLLGARAVYFTGIRQKTPDDMEEDV